MAEQVTETPAAGTENLSDLADEQTALRRVAALVTEGVAAEEVFAVAAQEIARVLQVPTARIARFDPDAAVVLGEFNYHGFPVGSVWPHDAPGVARMVFESGRPARVDVHSKLGGVAAATNRALGIRSAVGAPIVVDGGVWGLIVVATTEHDPLPVDTEGRLARFTELMAISIASTESRAKLRELLDEQAALHHVARLVTEGAGSSAVFDAVCAETGRVIGASSVNLAHYTPEGINVTMAGWSQHGTHVPEGTRLPLAPDVIGFRIRQTSAPARIESYEEATSELALLVRSSGIRSSVGAPIIVDRQVWGALIGSTLDAEPLPTGTELRLARFTELVATAIANADAREGLSRMAEEQAALRRRFSVASEQSRANLRELLDEQAALHRVARLVAEGADSPAVFDAVCAETGRVIEASSVNLAHYTPDGFNVTMAGWSLRGTHLPGGTRLPLAPDTIGHLIQQTSAPARIDSYDDATSELAVLVRESGIRSSVAAPIIVDGRAWGALVAGTDGDDPLPAGTEERLARFGELVAAAISSADARDSLRRLADEQAALRRVATLVAEGAPARAVFDAVCAETGRLVGAATVNLSHYTPDCINVTMAGWSLRNTHIEVGTRFPIESDTIGGQILATRGPARINTWDETTSELGKLVRSRGVRSSVGAPVVIEGKLWGALVAATDREEPLPTETESRLGTFAELIATAIANTEARAEVDRLADEQAALRRVATLVARGTPSTEVFEVVAMEVGNLLDTEITILGRYDGDGYATAIGNWSASAGGVPVGTRSALGGRNLLSLVAETGKPARLDGYDDASGEAADIARRHGWRSSIAAPIVVEGRVWGVMLVATQRQEAFPAGAEERLAAFTDLVATALANAQARDGLHRLADEQAALRRVATLVARGSSPEDVFWAVIEEVRGVLSCDAASLLRYHEDYSRTELADTDFELVGERTPLGGHNAATLVYDTRRPVRIDDYARDATGPSADHALHSGWRSCVAVPLNVEGHLWGVVMAASKTHKPLPSDAEDRLAKFTELIATAISNTEARDGLRELAEEQAGLRRVATLVVEDVARSELFAAVADEVAAVLGVSSASVSRFLPDGVSVVLASLNDPGFPVGSRWRPDEGTLNATILETGRPVRIDQNTMAGPIAKASKVSDVRSVVGAPIVVEGSVWGMVAVGRQHSDEPLPADTEVRLTDYTELIATAISNAEARDGERRLAEEQASLRRVATLIADGAPSGVLFAAVAQEVAEILQAPAVTLLRYEPDRMMTVVAALNDPLFPVGSRWPLEGASVAATVLETGRAARIADYANLSGTLAEAVRESGFRSAFGAPIVVDGNVWGLIWVGSREIEPMPADTEARLTDFTELVATAISNAESRDGVRRLADEQAGLRRVATLVAEGATADALFAGVVQEVAEVLDVPMVSLDRYESEAESVTLASWGNEPGFRVGGRWPLDGPSVRARVLETRRPARIDDYAELGGTIAAAVRAEGRSASAGAPIVVDSRVWGVLTVTAYEPVRLAADIEARLGAFAELVATAISNAAARAELLDSRARIVAAGDEARRRIERNLHDGTQQRLIALGLDIASVRAAVPESELDLHANLERLEGEVELVLDEVRELSRGLHPAFLSRQGLGPSLRALARRCPLPVSLDVELPERPPETVETCTYFVVAEALTNAVRHAQASYLTVSIAVNESHLRAAIADDGIGGAEPGIGAGSGLIGLADRVNALGGRLEIESPHGRGTTISIDLPLIA